MKYLDSSSFFQVDTDKSRFHELWWLFFGTPCWYVPGCYKGGGRRWWGARLHDPAIIASTHSPRARCSWSSTVRHFLDHHHHHHYHHHSSSSWSSSSSLQLSLFNCAYSLPRNVRLHNVHVLFSVFAVCFVQYFVMCFFVVHLCQYLLCVYGCVSLNILLCSFFCCCVICFVFHVLCSCMFLLICVCVSLCRLYVWLCVLPVGSQARGKCLLRALIQRWATF